VTEVKEKVTTPFSRPLRRISDYPKAEYVRMQNESKEKHDWKNDDDQPTTYSLDRF
jgi:hypothetical protein